jgi:hypothetical protein
MLRQASRTPDRSVSDVGFHLRQALKGFGGGLLLVVPAVLWLSGFMSEDDTPKTRIPPVVISQVAIQPLAVGEATRPAPVSERSAPKVEIAAQSPQAAPAPPAKPATADRLRTARVLVSAGEIVRARELLAEPALAIDPEAIYLLAETFDPNVLAALGLVNVKAEPERARRLYRQALSDGVTAARQRLDALQ